MKKQKSISTVLIVALASIFFSCSKNEQYLPIEGEVLESRNSPIGITNPISGNTVFYDLLKQGLTFMDENTIGLEEPTDEKLLALFRDGICAFFGKRTAMGA